MIATMPFKVCCNFLPPRDRERLARRAEAFNLATEVGQEYGVRYLEEPTVPVEGISLLPKMPVGAKPVGSLPRAQFRPPPSAGTVGAPASKSSQGAAARTIRDEQAEHLEHDREASLSRLITSIC